ncbi:hypothetical protein V2J09_008493 [Rumex salicifolius]
MNPFKKLNIDGSTQESKNASKQPTPQTPLRSMAEQKREIHGVKIWTNPPDSVLSDLGVFAEWKKYASKPAKIPWTFDSGAEKMYLLKGKVNIYCDGHDDEPFQIAAGDLVEFPNAMKIVFDVVEAVEKHFLVIKD